MPQSQTRTLDLQQKIRNKIAEVQASMDEVPGVIIIHDIRDLSVVFMSKRGLDILGVTLEEIVSMGATYHTRFFNAEESKEYVPKIIGLLERNNDNEIITIFQQVRSSEKEPWHWYCTSIKIFMWDNEGKPLLTIGTAIPVDTRHPITAKASRLLEENNFLRKNYHSFDTLGKREREVLKLMALGKTSAEIATALFISVSTANTHRKNIRQKLNAGSSYELSQYARAFDLI